MCVDATTGKKEELMRSIYEKENRQTAKECRQHQYNLSQVVWLKISFIEQSS